MFSRFSAAIRHTAAWRLSAVATAVFALGTAAVFVAAYLMLASGIRQRGDNWLDAETASLAELAATAPRETLMQEFAREDHELTNRSLSVPLEPEDAKESVVFFALLDRRGTPLLVHAPPAWLEILPALDTRHLRPGPPRSVAVPGWEYPMRVASRALTGGDVLLVGESLRGDQQMLDETTQNLAWMWAGVTVCGFAVSWFGIRRVLARVNTITEVAAAIGPDQLGRRLPEEKHGDEIARLVATFNVMLDRIETSITQMRAIGDSVAHDLRSPVTAIRGSLEMALTSPENGELRDRVASALEGLDQLTAMLDASLDATEVEAGALRLRRELFDLRVLAEDVVELYLPAAQERGLALTLRAPAPVEVRADEGLLRRALTNLLDNALAHLPSGCTVQVSVHGDARRAAIAVKDDGPGFPPEIRDRAFDRFARGRKSEGTGLGLALVRAAALVHGGTVTLGQPAGGGTVIEIEVPAAASTAPTSS
ncbi:MAG: HAMP domain-containing protein [Acidobacteria bacterium]|nr:MAG: HAMP domain-containing protein [Acidobacteriota bacterium]